MTTEHATSTLENATAKLIEKAVTVSNPVTAFSISTNSRCNSPIVDVEVGGSWNDVYLCLVSAGGLCACATTSVAYFHNDG